MASAGIRKSKRGGAVTHTESLAGESNPIDSRPARHVASVNGTSFEQSAGLVLGRLQIALAELLRAVPGQTRTASEVERAFGVDYKLGWQVHRIATTKNPLAAGPSVPARVSMTKLLKAASRRHVPVEVVEKVSQAFGDFERLAEAEAEDREELDAMFTAFVPEVREKRELEAKRAAFKAMSQIKGVTMDAQVGAFVLHPSQDGSMVDRATFSAYLGLRRLRPAAHIGFGTISSTTPTSQVLTLDGAPPDGLHSILLTQYCSASSLHFDISRFGATTLYSVTGAHVGMRSAVELVMAEHRPGAMKRYRTPDGRRMSGVVNIPDIPMQRQTTDVFIHRDVYPGAAPLMGVYDTVPRGMVTTLDDPAREIDRVPFEEAVRPIPGGMADCAVTHLPKYTEMLEHVCEKLGWDPRSFRGFRLDVSYPVYGAQYMIGFTLPDAPG